VGMGVWEYVSEGVEVVVVRGSSPSRLRSLP
jgi:hypothetical protein